MKKNHLFIFFALLTKSTKLLKVIKLFKFGKIAITFISMSLSVFVYSFKMGVWFSVGFVLLLFAHEMGHVIALKIKKLPASAPVFIPMFGAIVFSPEFKNKEDEAFVGLGGPLLGGLTAFIVFIVWKIMPNPSEIILMLSYTATFVNIFNLIPIRPLDGGRITQAIGSWFRYVGMFVLLGFSLFVMQPAILLIWILVLDDIIINNRLKFGMGILLQVSMIVLMIMGFSDQSISIDIVDITLATIINIGFFAQHKSNLSTETKEEILSAKIRFKWFLVYVLITTMLALLMYYQLPYLPKM